MNRKLVNAVLHLIRNDPDGWVVSRHEATHSKSNTKIWIANSYYGLNVNGVGGVTFISSFFGFLTPWRVRILNAVYSLQAAKMLKSVELS